MNVTSNKRFAYDLAYALRSLLVICLLGLGKCFAQDTVVFNDVEISTKKTELSRIGKKTESIDSTVKEQFKYASVADLLAYNSSIFIKNYGPGNIATTSFRGGNAAQTAVLWNGFNLQNAMLGQSDLALMPAFLFENVEMEYGGSSSLWGSGAIGGSIHLNNKTAFGQGLRSVVNIGAGSFGSFNGSLGVLYSGPKFSSSTKLYTNSSENTFKYKDTLDKVYPEKRQKNAEYTFKGLMQEFKLLINSKQILSLNAWLTDNHRHLPNYTSYESKTYQKDDAMRLTVNWSYISSGFRSTVRGGYFRDRINYTDSISNTFSKSKAQNIMLENENYIPLHKNYDLNIALNALSSSAETENYTSVKTLQRASLLLGNKFTLVNGRLLAYVSARAEYFSVGKLPLTGNASLEYKLLREVTAKLNAARVYRQPTLNELYWIPGGNKDLKAEEGYTYEGEINYTKQLKDLLISVSASAYSRKIENWILWVPGSNGNPTPVNVQKVWSRGTETSWKLSYRKNKFRAGTGIITGYVLSTVESVKQENDNTKGKQLIYTPRYTVNGHVSAGYADLDLIYYHQYSGYRFTSSDNLQWIDPYHVSSLRLNYKLKFKIIDLSLFAACNNLFSANYAVLGGRPMPLRYYESGISIQTRSLHKNKQQ